MEASNVHSLDASELHSMDANRSRPALSRPLSAMEVGRSSRSLCRSNPSRDARTQKVCSTDSAVGPPFRISLQSIVSISHMIVFG